MDNQGVLAIAIVIYTIIGMIAVKYVKSNLLGIDAEYTNSLYNYFIRNMLWGFFLGWLAIPVALIHWLVVGRNR